MRDRCVIESSAWSHETRTAWSDTGTARVAPPKVGGVTSLAVGGAPAEEPPSGPVDGAPPEPGTTTHHGPSAIVPGPHVTFEGGSPGSVATHTPSRDNVVPGPHRDVVLPPQ